MLIWISVAPITYYSSRSPSMLKQTFNSTTKFAFDDVRKVARGRDSSPQLKAFKSIQFFFAPVQWKLKTKPKTEGNKKNINIYTVAHTHTQTQKKKWSEKKNIGSKADSNFLSTVVTTRANKSLAFSHWRVIRCVDVWLPLTYKEMRKVTERQKYLRFLSTPKGEISQKISSY